MAIELGQTVTDSITGFTGVTIATAEYLYGRRQACVAATELGERGVPVTIWFDEQRLGPPGEAKATAGSPEDTPPPTHRR